MCAYMYAYAHAYGVGNCMASPQLLVVLLCGQGRGGMGGAGEVVDDDFRLKADGRWLMTDD